MTLDALKENHYPIAVNTGISIKNEAMVFTLYAENWNDFDNDHYLLDIEKNDKHELVELPNLEDVNSLAKELTGNTGKDYFTMDEDGEIQGDIYGKVVRKESPDVS